MIKRQTAFVMSSILSNSLPSVLHSLLDGSGLLAKPPVLEDKLFQALEEAQGTKPWGRLLDAGTGSHSLKWIATLNTPSWTAVTADAKFAENVKREILPIVPRSEDQIVIGNWQDEAFLEGERYDTILADYLIGAIDGFAPFFQEEIFERLKRHLAPDGRLYIVGLQPVPDHPGGTAEIVAEVTKLRDACILLAGHRTYREFPQEWVTRQLQRTGFKVMSSKRLPILYSDYTIKRQLDVASRKLPLFQNRALAATMEQHIADVYSRVKKATASTATGRIQLGYDYVIAAELKSVSAEVNSVTAASSPSSSSSSLLGKEGEGGDEATVKETAKGEKD